MERYEKTDRPEERRQQQEEIFDTGSVTCIHGETSSTALR